MIHSYWYIADTPGPALLGPPACKKLAMVQVNCAVMATQPKRSLTGSVPTQAARVAKPPAARTPKPKCIKSTDDLMREFPDRFTRIGKFPGDYKIQLCPDAHLVIHTPRKCLIALHPKVKEHLAKMEALGVITHIDQPTDWVSSITYIQKANCELHLCLDPGDLNRAISPWLPQDTYCRRSRTQIWKFTLLHQARCTSWILLNSPWWRIKSLNHLQQPLWEVWLPASSLWSGLLTRHLPEEDGPVPQRVPWMYWNWWWHHLHSHTEAEHDTHLWNLMWVACKYGVVFNPQKMHIKAPA